MAERVGTNRRSAASRSKEAHGAEASDTLEEALGRALAMARQGANMTQVVAAAAIGISQSRLAKLETGRRRLTYLDALVIARTYGVSIGSFEAAMAPTRRGLTKRLSSPG